MGNQTDEQFQKSVSLAKSLAHCERTLRLLRNLRAPKTILNNAEDSLRKKWLAVQGDIIATELLPQARIHDEMEEARASALADKTMFGQLLQGFETLGLILCGGLKDHNFNPFTGARDNELWKQFRKGIKKGNQKAVIDALFELLTGAKWDIVFMELPPPPPTTYSYKEKTYLPEDIH